jgi:hypothetical protein
VSGSPVIQNGKLVGAVTHALVNDPTASSLKICWKWPDKKKAGISCLFLIMYIFVTLA